MKKTHAGPKGDNMNLNDDVDPIETTEWVDALRSVAQHRGPQRTNHLVNRLVDLARQDGVYVPRSLNTAYKNTIEPQDQAKSPGDRDIEHRLRSIIRWNAMAIILRANKDSSELGGHIASFQSAATLYDIGFGHFWHAPTEQHGGDLIYIQGHCSPGI
jgi:pyruvate dehydrogenase E1 component